MARVCPRTVRMLGNRRISYYGTNHGHQVCLWCALRRYSSATRLCGALWHGVRVVGRSNR
eukprot:2412391-Prymnesium_polylepis.1